MDLAGQTDGQTDGQTERACALDYGSSWDDNLPYAEFSYNNSYQASIEMAHSKLCMGRSVLHHCYGVV
jgi:hypothetical protein